MITSSFYVERLSELKTAMEKVKPQTYLKKMQVEISKLNYVHLCLGTSFGNTTPGQETARTEDADGSDHMNIKHIRTKNPTKTRTSNPTK